MTETSAAAEIVKIAASSVTPLAEITVKGVRMIVKTSWYEGRYNKPGAKRMTNMVGFEPAGGGEIVWVAAHVKVIVH